MIGTVVNTKELTISTEEHNQFDTKELSRARNSNTMVRVASDNGDRRTVQLSREAHRAFSDACEQPPIRRSMYDVATRLMTWFASQSDVVKTAITSDVDQGMERAYADTLERLAAELRLRADQAQLDNAVDTPLSELTHGGQPMAAEAHPRLGPNGRLIVAGKELGTRVAAKTSHPPGSRKKN